MWRLENTLQTREQEKDEQIALKTMKCRAESRAAAWNQLENIREVNRAVRLTAFQNYHLHLGRAFRTCATVDPGLIPDGLSPSGYWDAGEIGYSLSPHLSPLPRNGKEI